MRRRENNTIRKKGKRKEERTCRWKKTEKVSCIKSCRKVKGQEAEERLKDKGGVQKVSEQK